MVLMLFFGVFAIDAAGIATIQTASAENLLSFKVFIVNTALMLGAVVLAIHLILYQFYGKSVFDDANQQRLDNEKQEAAEISKIVETAQEEFYLHGLIKKEGK